MRNKPVCASIALLALAFAAAASAPASAQNITGTILIKKRLSRPSVTAEVPVYQRGTEVKLANDADDDPLAYERSRVAIYLEGPEPAGARPASLDATAAAPVEVVQLGRRFLPNVLVVPVGSTVSFPNMDPIFHNVFSLSKAKTFDLGSYDKGDTRKVTFSKPGVVDIYCHLHPNMTATIVVTPNRYYARADADGHFRIDNVPPGRYTVVAWHKTAGFFRKQIVVEDGQDAVADFFIPIGDPK